MFTDTEAMLMMVHKRNMSAVVNDAQRIVDRQAAQIANLRFALQASRQANGELRADIGRRAIGDLLAFRAARRKAAN